MTPWKNIAIWQKMAALFFMSRCVFDDAGNVIETHKAQGQFKEW
jgi:hypothetical protein